MTMLHTGPIEPGWYRENRPPFDERYFDGGRWRGRRRFGSKGDAPPSKVKSTLRVVRTLVMLLGPAIGFILLLNQIAHDDAFWQTPQAPSLGAPLHPVLGPDSNANPG